MDLLDLRRLMSMESSNAVIAILNTSLIEELGFNRGYDIVKGATIKGALYSHNSLVKLWSARGERSNVGKGENKDIFIVQGDCNKTVIS